MDIQSYAGGPGYWFIAYGLLLSCISAFVPFYEAGYTLMFSVLLAGLLPYLVYSVAVPLMRGSITTVVGIALVAAHTWLVINERFIGGADYSDGMIYYVPMALSVAVLPLAVAAFRRPWLKQ